MAHLSVAMSCDEKNNKRRKKRSKQSSEGNSHAPKSVENREVCSRTLSTRNAVFTKKRINTMRSGFQVMYVCCFDGNFLFPSGFSLGLGGLLKMECLFFT